MRANLFARGHLRDLLSEVLFSLLDALALLKAIELDDSDLAALSTAPDVACTAKDADLHACLVTFLHDLGDAVDEIEVKDVVTAPLASASPDSLSNTRRYLGLVLLFSIDELVKKRCITATVALSSLFHYKRAIF